MNTFSHSRSRLVSKAIDDCPETISNLPSTGSYLPSSGYTSMVTDNVQEEKYGNLRHGSETPVLPLIQELANRALKGGSDQTRQNWTGFLLVRGPMKLRALAALAPLGACNTTNLTL